MYYKITSSQYNFYPVNINSRVWNQSGIIQIKKVFSYEQLNHSLNSVIKDNDFLRCCFKEVNNYPATYIDEFKSIDFPYYDFSSEEELYKVIAEYKNITLKNGLFEAFVFNLGENSGFFANFHHLLIDGYSMLIMAKHLNKYLNNEFICVSNNISYYEYIQNEEIYINSKRYQKDRNFWLQQFSDNPQCSIFEEKKTSFDYASDEVNFRIDPELFNKIKAFCEINNISVQSYFNTVYSTYIFRTLGTDFFTVGVPVLNRTTEAELNTIGLYMHIVPLLVKLKDDSFLQNAIRVEDAQMNLFRHQKFTQHDIKELLKEEGRPQNNLFDIATDYQEFEENEDYEFEFVYSNALSLPLEIHMQSFGPEKHNLKIRYRTSMFSEKEIQTMLNSFIAIIEDTLDNPEKKITELSMILSEEKNKVLYEFNDTASEYRKDKCIHELFEEQAEKTPDKVAVVAADKTLTYRELNEEANRIAHSLIEAGIGKGDIVGIKLPRKSCFMAALFGVLKTGAAYLPLDPDHPEERIKGILIDSKAKLCISEDNFFSLLDNSTAENPDNSAKPDDLCYCIYTSGSTGSPKGTLLYHRNLVWYMSVLKKLYGTENINMPFFTSQSVDLTVPSIYFPLITGGTTYMYNGELKNDLVEIFDNEKLNIIKFTPTHIGIVNKVVPAKSCSNIRCVIVGGESFYKDTCIEFLNKFGKHIEIHNEYGPTEATVSCTDYIVRPHENTCGAYFSIGGPVNNAQIYITDNYLKPVPVGVTGELCIAGDGVGAGYLNDPELTAERFIDNPFGEGKLYRTGDLAYWQEDGNIVFAGRKDFQVKIRGLRVELGEIENAVSGIDGINMSAAVVRNDAQDRPVICAFYTGAEKEANQLRQMLGDRLPKYMIPHIFAHLEEMPLTVSGKVDRNALPEIELESICTQAEYIAPKTLKEKALYDAVCAVMKLSSISMQENFFNAGGDSIKAIYIVSQLEEQGYELRVSDVMQKETFSEMAQAMELISEKVVYNQNEENGFIPFSPIMHTYLKENGKVSNDFVHSCTVSVDCDEETARKAFDILVSHHDILRGTICENGINIHSSEERAVYSFEHIITDNSDDLKEYPVKKTLDDGNLVHVTLCETDKEKLLSISIHHFLVDLISWEILIMDFMTVVEQLKKKEPISLPAKTASFKLWNEQLQKYAETISEESKSYWKSVNEKLDDVKVLSSDAADCEKTEKISFVLDESLTAKLLNDANYKYGTKPNEVLLTALGLAAAEMAEGSVGIIIEGHGRAELDKPIALDRTVGWFTVCYPVAVNNNSNITDELINIKETLRRIPRSGIDYLLLTQDFHKNAEIKFNFYQAANNEESSFVGFNFNGSVFRNKINVDCSVADGILSVSISVPGQKYEAQFGEQLGRVFREYIEKLVAACTENDIIIKTRSDFSDDELTETELDELKDLFDWTDDYEQ